MRVTEMVQEFQGMLACDKIHLLCQMLRCCLPQELHFILTVLLGFKEENGEKWAKQEVVANQVTYLTELDDGGILAGKNVARLCYGVMLLRPDNRAVVQDVCKVLDDKDLMETAKNCENLDLLAELRLLYVLGVYHPAFPYSFKQQMMATLGKLDFLYEQKEAEVSSGPSDDAYILSCEVKGVYKRTGGDKRLPYVIKIVWSDGTISYIQRTYGDFFSFQNKLLDLFPEESGQRNKKQKQRTIPFLPGRKLFSGRNNMELAEKRLPELYQYTRELVSLPTYLSRCKHVLDFFRPWDSEIKYDEIPWNKLKTLQDVRKKRFRAVGLVSPTESRSQSTAGRVSHTLPLQTNQKSEAKEGESPLARRFTYPARPGGAASAFTRVATNVTAGVHGKMSSSQNSLSSGERLPGALTAAATTAACRVVTPPTKRTNGSPAFAVSGVANNRVVWAASSRQCSSESPDVVTKQGHGNGPVDLSSQSSSSFRSLDSPTTTVIHHRNNSISKATASVCMAEAPVKSDTGAGSRDWADRCSSPPLESSMDTSYPSSSTFVPISTSSSSRAIPLVASEPKLVPTAATTMVTSTMAASTPTASSTTTGPSRGVAIATAPATVTAIPSPSPTGYMVPPPRGIPFSPSLPQLYTGIHTPYSLGAYPLGSSPLGSPIPSPQRHLPLRTSHTPTATSTISESEHFSRWLKGHRLHKYSHLFLNMNFDEVCKLTVDQLKRMGMTLGAAKKLCQKLEELRTSGATSFRDISLVNISRKPSTSSLPAALVVDPKLTPSSSIDQLSLHSSTCSLDVIGQAHSHTPISTAGLSQDSSVVDGNMDSSTLEPGATLDYNSDDEPGDTGTLKYGIRASNSQSSVGSAQSGTASSRGKFGGSHAGSGRPLSHCSLESTSPQALLPGDAPGDGGGGPHRERVSSLPEKRCTSVSPTQRLFSTPQPPHPSHASTTADWPLQQGQRPFAHHAQPINALWEVQLHLQRQQQQQVAVAMANCQQQLSYPGSMVVAAGTGWSPQQAVNRPPPMLANSFGHPQHVVHTPYPPHGNGVLRIPLVDPIHLSVACPTVVPAVNASSSATPAANRGNPRQTVTCCNCARQGHTATACPFNTTHSLRDLTISGPHSYREIVK